MLKPLHRRLAVFAVRERTILRTHSGIYLPNNNYGELTKSEDIWVYNWAKNCTSKWKQGQHLLVSDAFEFDYGCDDDWREIACLPVFDELKVFAESVGGKIKAFVVSERSILAEVEGGVYQEDSMW